MSKITAYGEIIVSVEKMIEIDKRKLTVLAQCIKDRKATIKKYEEKIKELTEVEK